MTENRHEENPAQMMFEFMYQFPYGYRQLSIDFGPSLSGPMNALEMLQKRDNIEKNENK